MKAAAYLRVSTDGQSTENQRRDLTEAANRRGWTISFFYEDAGISGAKGRDKWPAFDKILKDAVRGRFDVLMGWSVDKLGRSLQDLVGMMSELHGCRSTSSSINKQSTPPHRVATPFSRCSAFSASSSAP
jgi:DNA invertase Pin-like site-specific DNA recombinase